MYVASGQHSPHKGGRDDIEELGVGLVKRSGRCFARCGEHVGVKYTFNMLSLWFRVQCSEVIVSPHVHYTARMIDIDLFSMSGRGWKSIDKELL